MIFIPQLHHSPFFYLTLSIGPRWCIQTCWSQRQPCWRASPRSPLAACPCSQPWGCQHPLDPDSPREAPVRSGRLRSLPNWGVRVNFTRLAQTEKDKDSQTGQWESILWDWRSFHLWSRWGHSSAKFSYLMTYRKGSWQTLDTVDIRLVVQDFFEEDKRDERCPHLSRLDKKDKRRLPASQADWHPVLVPLFQVFLY